MNSDTSRLALWRIAHGRAGDKGNTATISLIAYEPEYFALLVEFVTEERAGEVFRTRAPSAIRRYVLPKLGAIHFVIENVLDGGVNESLNLDSHGKTLAFALLGMEVPVPAGLAASLAAER